MNTTLVSSLLAQYSNLYLSVKEPNSDFYNPNSTKYIDGNGNIKSEWQTVFQNHPNQIIMAADHFFYSPKVSQAVVATSFEETWGTAFPKFSSDLKAKFGTTNTKTLFNLQ